MQLEQIESTVASFTSKLKEMKRPDDVIEFQSGVIASLVAALTTKDLTIQQTLLDALNLRT